MNFQLKKAQVIYKLQKGSPKTISNQKITDELAIEFLKINPERLRLFSKYPENISELIGETKEEEVVHTESKEVTPEPKKTAQKKVTKKPCKSCKKKTITKRKRNGSK